MAILFQKKGVQTDPSKVSAIDSWPVPVNAKEVRSFSGLEGYHRKFVRNFAVISRPLSDLTKKGGFSWSDEAQAAFQ